MTEGRPRPLTVESSPGPLAAVLWALAAMAFASAMQMGCVRTPPSFGLVILGAALLLVGVALAGRGIADEASGRFLPWVSRVAVVLFFVLLLTRAPGVYLAPGTQLLPFYVTVGVVGIVALSTLRGRPASPAVDAVIILSYLVLGAWVIHASPRPAIDTWVWHQDALAALLRGDNPYAMTMPNIYGHGAYYGEGMLDGDRVLNGYQYPPASLLFGLPAYLLAGDYRYAGVVAMAVSGILLLAAGRNTLTRAAVVMLLFQPRGFFVLEQGWTEPSLVFAMSLVIWSGVRAPKLLPWSVGLLISLKQHMFLFAPLCLLMLPGPWTPRRLAGLAARAAVVVAATWLPFLLWDPAALWHSAFAFHLAQPLRSDAWSLAAWMAERGVVIPGWVGFVAASGVVAVSVSRMPRGPAWMASGIALSSVALFLLSKQAFTNYYFWVCSLLALAIGCAWPVNGRPGSIQDRRR